MQLHLEQKKSSAEDCTSVIEAKSTSRVMRNSRMRYRQSPYDGIVDEEYSTMAYSSSAAPANRPQDIPQEQYHNSVVSAEDTPGYYYMSRCDYPSGYSNAHEIGASSAGIGVSSCRFSPATPGAADSPPVYVPPCRYSPATPGNSPPLYQPQTSETPMCRFSTDQPTPPEDSPPVYIPPASRGAPCSSYSEVASDETLSESGSESVLPDVEPLVGNKPGERSGVIMRNITAASDVEPNAIGMYQMARMYEEDGGGVNGVSRSEADQSGSYYNTLTPPYSGYQDELSAHNFTPGYTSVIVEPQQYNMTRGYVH